MQSKEDRVMEKNDDIQYWVDRFIPLYKDLFNNVIDENEFKGKAVKLHNEMEQNFPPDGLVLMDCIIEGLAVQEYNKFINNQG